MDDKDLVRFYRAGIEEIRRQGISADQASLSDDATEGKDWVFFRGAGSSPIPEDNFAGLLLPGFGVAVNKETGEAVLIRGETTVYDPWYGTDDEVWLTVPPEAAKYAFS